MVFLDDLKDLVLYKKPFVLPIDEKHIRSGSLIYLVSPNAEASNKMMNYPYLINKMSTYNSYYIERNALYYINQEGCLEEPEDRGEYLTEVSEEYLEEKFFGKKKKASGEEKDEFEKFKHASFVTESEWKSKYRADFISAYKACLIKAKWVADRVMGGKAYEDGDLSYPDGTDGWASAECIKHMDEFQGGPNDRQDGICTKSLPVLAFYTSGYNPKREVDKLIDTIKNDFENCIPTVYKNKNEKMFFFIKHSGSYFYLVANSIIMNESVSMLGESAITFNSSFKDAKKVFDSLPKDEKMFVHYNAHKTDDSPDYREVLSVDGTPVAYVEVGISRKKGKFAGTAQIEIACRPDRKYRHHGYARELMERAIIWAHSSDAKKLVWVSDRKNAGSIKIAKAFGFKESDELLYPNWKDDYAELCLDVSKKALQEKALTAKEKEAIPNSEYGLPNKKKYPLNDVKHLKSAIRFFNYVSEDDEAELARNIKRRAKELKVPIRCGDGNRLSKYITEEYMQEFMAASSIGNNIYAVTNGTIKQHMSQGDMVYVYDKKKPYTKKKKKDEPLNEAEQRITFSSSEKHVERIVDQLSLSDKQKIGTHVESDFAKKFASYPVDYRSVLVVNGVPAAFLCVVTDDCEEGEGCIILATVPRYRRMGYGTMLYQKLIDSNKYKKLYWEVDNDNSRSMAMAKKLGFDSEEHGLVVEACKNEQEARKFVHDVGKLAKKYNANYFIVTDGASGKHNQNNENDAVNHARKCHEEWEKQNGFDPDEDWIKDGSFKESYVLTESILFSKDNVVINYEKYASGKCNVLLVTGLSGGGKTTAAHFLSGNETSAGVVHLDMFEHSPNMTDEYIQKEQPCLWEYFSTHKSIQQGLKDNKYHGKDMCKVVRDYAKYAIKWCKSKAPERWIIEGVQIYSQFDYSELKQYPMVLVGTSAFTAIIRRLKRNGNGKINWKKELSKDAEFKQLLAWYKDEEKIYRAFYKAAMKSDSIESIALESADDFDELIKQLDDEFAEEDEDFEEFPTDILNEGE